MSANEILAIVAACLALASTYFGAKYQNTLNKVAAVTQDLASTAQHLNQVIVGAKDGNVNETEFQVLIDDAKAFLKDL
jgi:hypothetical protein